MLLKGKTALITGASRGIGKAIALAYAAEGCDIAFTYIVTKDFAERTCKEIEALGVKCMAYASDASSFDGAHEVVKQVIKDFGKLDILVNNAGTGAVDHAENITDEQFQKEFDVDLFGTFKFARAVANQAMIPANYGRIINIASMYGLVGNKVAGSAPYHAAKGGVVNLTRALAAEWGKYKITVNSICPGYFYTPLTTETLNSDFFQQNARTMIPLERYGNEGELDTAVVFLASPNSSYVTGIALPVDGGYTCM